MSRLTGNTSPDLWRFGQSVWIVAILAVLSTLFVATPASAVLAVTRTWVGPSGGLWSIPVHWSPAGSPASGDTVVFDPRTEEARSVVDYAVTLAGIETPVSAARDIRVEHTLVGQITLTGDIIARARNVVLDVPVVLSAGQHTIDSHSLSVTFRDTVSGPGGVVTTGAGWVSWTAESYFDGPATLGAANNVVYAGASLGSLAAGTTVAAGASLELFQTDALLPFAEPLRLTGSGNPQGTGTLHFSFTPHLTGPIELVGDVVITGTGAELSGPITGTGRLLARSNGLTVSHGGNTYTGGTLVNTVMEVTADGALGSGPVEITGSRSLTLLGDVGLANPITLRTPYGKLAAAEGDASLTGPLTFVADWDSFFYSGGSINVAEEASLSVQGGLHGDLDGSVRKAGGGALVIEGSQTSTFAGSLQVGEGALVAAAVPGSAAVPRRVMVEDGAALVTVAPDQLRDATVGLGVDAVFDLLGHDQSLNYLGAGGVVLLGYAEDGTVHHATLRANDAYLSEALLAVVIGANGSDRIEVSGTATLGGALLDVTVTGEVPLGREHVIVRAGKVDGAFANVADGQYASFENRSFRASYRAGDGNDISLTRADAVTTPPPAPAPAPVPTAPTPNPAPTQPSRSGYWMVGADGAVYAFGTARWLGNAQVGSTPADDLEPTPSNLGYWVLDATGRIHAFGDAAVLGDLGGRLAASEKATSISATPSGRGYWLFTTSGRAVPFGDASFFGDMSGTRLNGPVLDSVPTPTGRGYYMVASDGGIFAFGDAGFAGSMGGSRLNAPVQSLVPDGDGRGYWLVASDGGIFAFSAPFYGSMGASRLNRPVTGMVAAGTGGYLMVGEDGGIFAFGSASFHGSLGNRPPVHPITAIAVVR